MQILYYQALIMKIKYYRKIHMCIDNCKTCSIGKEYVPVDTYFDY